MSISLVLSAFSDSFTLTNPALIVVPDVSLNESAATIDLDMQVPVSTIRDTFYIQTDELITMDASFVYYYVDAAAWANDATAPSQTALNPKNGTITGANSGAYVEGDVVSKDFIRNLAHQLFGTYLGADLFTNEDALVTDINAQCTAIATEIQAKINSVDVSGGNFEGMVPGLNGKYLKDVESNRNLTRELFNQMRNANSGGTIARFENMPDLAYAAKGTGFYHLPFVAGDTISFNLLINPEPTQHTVIATKPDTPLVPRMYRVRLTVGADP